MYKKKQTAIKQETCIPEVPTNFVYYDIACHDDSVTVVYGK